MYILTLNAEISQTTIRIRIRNDPPGRIWIRNDLPGRIRILIWIRNNSFGSATLLSGILVFKQSSWDYAGISGSDPHKP